MNKFEAERAAAAKIVSEREAAALKVAEANRAVISDVYGAIAEGETKRRVQRRADFAAGTYGTLDELLAAARKL